MGVDWSYFNRFEEIDNKYLPARGEGKTKATQITTAVSKLVYKWYNDGDVFDNTYSLSGWWNDLSSYANWLAKYTEEGKRILENIKHCLTGDDYEELLKELCDTLQNMDYLAEQDKLPKVGSIYNCEGDFRFEEG
jgi:hypothetical protein